MAAEHPFDVSTVPELARLAEEVRVSRRPRVLRRANEDIAVRAPLPAGRRRPVTASRGGTAAALAVVAQTAGIFRDAARHPPVTIEEETAAFERAVADEVMHGSGG